MEYCSHCASRLKIDVPPRDNHPRHICTGCGMIHYRSPKLVVGCIPEWQDQILLCRRAIEPRYGLWTLPAGFMEVGETVQEGAARETLEEAGAKVKVGQLYTLFNLPRASLVNLIFRAELIDPNVAAGEESLEVGFFRESEIPWSDLSFPMVRETLRLYFHDRKHGIFATHSGSIIRTPGPILRYQVIIDP
ncbi:ADP-ribose pyrophosphatase [Achromatium sp. WMS2]|nr:ADP-ribose pyrophosphatase [Achromatium sp. WMS2]